MSSQVFFHDIEVRAHQALLSFYSPYFSEMKETEDFVERIYGYDWNNRIPRQMLYQVERFITLAEDIDKIRPGRDGLRVVFIKTCMEALAYLGNKEPKMFYPEFEACFSKEGEKYILDNFQLIGFEQEIHGMKYTETYDLCIQDFLLIIKAIRDKVVH